MDYITGLRPERTQDKDAFLCMDLNETNSVVRPNYYSGVTIAYIPCANLANYPLTGGSYDVDPECETDPAALEEYMDIDKYAYYQTFLHYNFEYFDSEKYGEESV